MSTENTQVLTKTKIADSTWFSFKNYKQESNEDGTLKTYWLETDEYDDIAVKNSDSEDRFEIKSVITINKSIFSVPLEKIISVYLRVFPKEGGSFFANGETCYYGAYTNADIDLSAMLPTSTTAQNINIELTANGGNLFLINASGENAPVFEMIYYEDGELITQSIEVCTPPKYRHYLDGERFNPHGMTINVNYTNGSHQTVADGFTYSPEILRYGDEAVTISYDEKTCTQEVTVLEDSFMAMTCKSEGEYGDNPKVNLSTGRLTYTLPCMSVGANDRAIDVTAIYSTISEDFCESLSKMPRGWKLNVQQFVKKQGQTYTYMDGNGYLHQFKLYDSNEGLYHDCDGIGLVLKEKSNGVEIIDESNNKLTFNSNGCITDIVAGINGDVHKVFSYDGDKLVRIFDARSQYNNEDGYNESLLFTYTEQGNIDEVKACKGSSCIKTTKFVYSGNTLIRLETKVGTSVIQRYGLSYDEKELLKAVTEINGINAILINYDDDCRVKEIQYAKQCSAGAYEPNYKVVDTFRFDYNMIGETEWVLSTVVTNKNNVSIIYYLNRKNKIISSFEAVKNAEGQIIGLKDLSVGSTKTLAGAGGSVLFNEEPCALGSYGQYIYDVPDEFILWRDDTEKANKYYGCSFYLKHKEICERLKLTAKYKFALNGETCQEQTASVFVDGTACDAWQKVGIVLSLPEVEDEKDVVTLEELKIYVKNLDNFIVQQIELSPLNFAPTAKSDLLVSAGDGQIYFTQINKISLTKADNSDTIMIENNKDTYHYFTEQDLLRTVLNKMRNSYAVNDVECFDVICNNGKKRISKVKELTFTVNGADNLAYALPLTFTNKFVSQNGYNVTEQRTIFGADGIILEKAVSAVNNHSSSSQSRVNYFGQTLSETDEYGVTKEYTYDGSGILVQSVLLGRNAYGEREGRMVCAVSTYDEDGYLESESDGINTIVYEYNKPFNVIAKESLTIGGIVHEKLYEYNLVGRLLSVTLKVNGAVKARNEITYDKGLVRTVTDGYVKYGIIHDHEGNSATYTVFNGEEEVPVQIQTEVFDEESATTKIETRYIKDGMSEDVVSAVYDLYGRMHGLHYGSLAGNSLSGSNDVTYTYANLGGASQLAQPLLTVTDTHNNKQYIYQFDYDGNVKKCVREDITSSTSFFFIIKNENSGTVYTTSPFDKSQSHTCYDENVLSNPRITGVEKYFGNAPDRVLSEIKCLSTKYTYNPLGLLATKRVCCGRGGTYAYTYDTDGNGNTLPRFKKVRYSLDSDNFSEREYTYDERGNILTQKVTSTSYYDDPTLGNYSMYYTYDQNNRLVSEVKKLTGSEGEVTLWQKTYAYDQSGRLSTVVENDGNGNVTTCYLYDSAGRVVKATVGNQEVNYTYDVAGNLLSATGDTDKPFSCAWSKGGLLTGVTVNGVTTSYAYDHQNIRIGKTGTTDKNYFVDGTKIIAENIGTTQRLVYFYDGDSLVGFKLHDGPDLIYPKAALEDGYCYQYVRDEQNNVIGLTDCIGTLVARYEYDAWGNHKVLDANGVVNANPNFIGNLNPFRYRGYYYDVETGLYYCNARYYSPLLRRWISPDAFSYLDPESINGLNLYAYCGNNPVMGYDPYGTFDLWEFFRGVGNIVTGALAIGAGAIVLIGGAPIGMLIVAGITVGAGVLTLNNGIADTVGSFTGYNYMSDGLFNGNTTAYNWYSGITSTVAGIGTAICGNFIKTEYFMRGATPGTEGKMTLQPGMELDRYGPKYGRFLTNPGTAPGQLKLPASNNLVLNHYKVLKPFKVATGIVDGGGGFQYFTWRSVHRLIQMGYLAII